MTGLMRKRANVGMTMPAPGTYAFVASFASAVCYLVARRDFPPRAAVLVVIGVLIVGPVLAQIVSAWAGISAGWLGLFFGFALIWTIDQVAAAKSFRK